MCLYVLIPLSFFPTRLQSLEWGPTPMPYYLVLTWLHLPWHYFQIRSSLRCQRLGFRHIFWGAHTEPQLLYYMPFFFKQCKVIGGPCYAAVWHMDCILKAHLQTRKGMDLVRWQEPQEWDWPQDTLLSAAVKKNRLVTYVLICKLEIEPRLARIWGSLLLQLVHTHLYLLSTRYCSRPCMSTISLKTLKWSLLLSL